MKKTVFTIVGLVSVIIANAQGYDPHLHKSIPDKFIEIPIFILAVYLAATFILRIIKMILDNRLKHKLVEKGMSAEIIREMLQPNPADFKREIVKWTVLFIGICIGFGISYFFQPYGNHTVLIMSASVAVSFLVFYNFFYKSNK